MNRKQRIYKLLEKKFGEFSIKIVDNSQYHSGHNNFDGKNETHLKLLFKNKSSDKVNRLEIHRKVNKLLKSEFNLGLHSLEIKIN